jgi:hypothetical protein
MTTRTRATAQALPSLWLLHNGRRVKVWGFRKALLGLSELQMIEGRG